MLRLHHQSLRLAVLAGKPRSALAAADRYLPVFARLFAAQIVLLRGYWPAAAHHDPQTKVVGRGTFCLLGVFAALVCYSANAGAFDLYRGGKILTDRCAQQILRTGQRLAVTSTLALLLPTVPMLAFTFPKPVWYAADYGGPVGQHGWRILHGGLADPDRLGAVRCTNFADGIARFV